VLSREPDTLTFGVGMDHHAAAFPTPGKRHSSSAGRDASLVRAQSAISTPAGPSLAPAVDRGAISAAPTSTRKLCREVSSSHSRFSYRKGAGSVAACRIGCALAAPRMPLDCSLASASSIIKIRYRSERANGD
jgi:hypothetical protein